MPNKSPTLNRFSLFGLFAHQAPRYLDDAEDDARSRHTRGPATLAAHEPTSS